MVDHEAGADFRHSLFTAAKYLTYTLLLFNVFLFLREELGSLQHTFTSAMSVAQFVQVFAATIDTTAWVLLLLLLELETSVLDDDQIQGWVKHSLHGVRLICGLAIVWAFVGYCAELNTLYQASVLDAWRGCEEVAEGWSLLIRIDDYQVLNAENCASVADVALRISDFNIVAAPDVLRATRYLAWTDVINAAAWILVVIMLEIEVRLQLKGGLTDRIVGGTRYVKYVLYSVLFVAAVYWGFEGKFLDFWDSSLWLFAFIFIELNVFDWQQETHDVQAMAASD
ncbi:MAG: hypothetical protein AB8B57_11400 [Congregibacter sp.]